MPDAPYRRSYRIEEEIRPLSPEEEERVRGRRLEWHASVRKRELARPNELLFAIPVTLAAAAFGLFRGLPAVAVTGALSALFFGVMFLVARRDAQARLEASKGPWHPPEGGFRVRETRVFARSVCGAVSDDEDYASWLLFEIPGERWFFVDPLCVPAGSDLERVDFEREEVHLVSLEPDGVYLSARSAGEKLPRRGASGRGEDYARDLERGFVWTPDPAFVKGNADGLAPEASLPAWMRSAVGPGGPE